MCDRTIWFAVMAALLLGSSLVMTPRLCAQVLAPLAGPAKDAMIEQVLTALTSQPLKAVPFLERRMSPLLASPLESRGTIGYEPGGQIEKRTTSPIVESVVVSATTITVKSGSSAPTTMRLDARPELSLQVQAWRALLAGESIVLRQYFDVVAAGSFDRWELRLTPLESRMKRAIRQILVVGERGAVRSIETTALDGSVSDLTLVRSSVRMHER